MTCVDERRAASGAAGSDTVLQWTWRPFDALVPRDVHDFLALRARIFVVEQGCPFLDPDDADAAAWHLLGRDGASGTLVAYLRAIEPGVRYDEPSIGRVVVDSAHRCRGLGRRLMVEGIARARALWPRRELVIGAQHRLEEFYRSLGFASEGAIYDEDGIDHVRMRLAASIRADEPGTRSIHA